MMIPMAMNMGIAQATGDYVAKMDAHSTYSPNYLTDCIRFATATDAGSVGGVFIHVPRRNTAMGRAIARTLSHPFGAGNAHFRLVPKEPRWVDAVAYGCFKTDLIQRIGLYNEDLAGSSDADLSVRLLKSGYKILLVPSARVYYRTTSDLKTFAYRQFRDGIWATYPLKFGRRVVSPRHVVPLAFVGGILTLAALAPRSRIARVALGTTSLAYSTALAGSTIHIAIEAKDVNSLATVPAAFVVRHLAYGLGSIVGLLKLLPALSRDTMQR
jgi:hypothetical protein